jgi:LacI family transcriptional regulator
MMRARRKPTLGDIAELLNISKATVSNALSGNRYVSPKTIKLVRKASKQLGYQVNIIARGLRTRTTNIVGVTVPDITEPFHGLLVHHVEEKLKEYGLEMLLGSYYFDLNEELRLIETFQRLMVRGIIAISGLDNNTVKYQDLSQGISTVFLERDPLNYAISAVIPDHRRISIDAVDFLVSRGHRKIAHLTIPFENFHTLKLRAEGYIEGLKKNGIEFDKSLLFIEPSIRLHEIQTAIQLADRIKETGASAVYVVSDYVAIGLVKGIVFSGLRVPEDISILSVTNVDYSMITSPSITSIDLSARWSAKRAVKMLLELKPEETIQAKRIFSPHKIIERESVGTK